MLSELLRWIVMQVADNENSLLDELVRGEWYPAVETVYTQTIGPLFHVIIFLIGPALIGIKYQKFAPVAMIILSSGIVFSMFFESTLQLVFASAAVLGFAGVLYSVVHK